MAAPDIFLSYNREDAARAKQFADALAAEGFDVWWDAALRSGQTYDEVTEEALHSAKAVVVLWSPRSVASRWVRAEATVADQNKTLLPVSIEPCRRPVMFELTQTADLAHWHGDRSDPVWRMFVDDARALVGGTSHGLTRRPTEANPDTAAAPTGKPPRLAQHNLMIAALLMAVILLGGAYFWFRPGPVGELAGNAAPVEVTIMPLTATGGGAEEAALAAGITDELINRLRRVPGLLVSSGNGQSPVEAEHRLVGSVYLDGKMLRVTTRLSDDSGRIVWSDSFDRELSDLFQMQEDIAAAIAKALSVSLDVGIDSRAYGGTNNPEAYEYYLRAKGTLCDSLGCESRISLLERAIALDSNYAKALGDLAAIYTIALYSASSQEEVDQLLARQEEFANRAVAVNPEVWTGQAALAWYSLAQRDFVAADEALRKVAKLDQGIDPDLMLNRASMLPQFGRLNEAWRQQEEAELIDPGRTSVYMQVARLIGRGRYGEAAEFFDRMMEQNPAFAASVPVLFAPDPSAVFWAKFLGGHPEEARAHAKTFSLGPAYEASGPFRYDPEHLPDLPPGELKRWADRKFGFAGRVELATLAMLPAHNGHFETAINYLRLAYQRPGNSAYHLLWNPAFAGLRKTEGFARLVTELGLVEAWRKSGDWGDFCEPREGGGITCH